MGLEPRRGLVAIADRDHIDPFRPEPLEGRGKGNWNRFDQNHDWRGSRRSGAASLIFDQCPSGERGQGRQRNPLSLLIGSNQRPQRHGVRTSRFRIILLHASAGGQRW